MSPATLARLEEETHAPAGVAARIESQELRQLLSERHALLLTLRRIDIRFQLRPELREQVKEAIALAGKP